MAGYRAKSEKSMQTIGAQNLAKLRPQVDGKLAAKEDERIASQDEVLRYLTAVMREEVDEEVVVIEGRGDGCSQARVVRKKAGVRDRNRAAELLAKRYGLLTDKVDVTAAAAVQIVDDLGDRDA